MEKMRILPNGPGVSRIITSTVKIVVKYIAKQEPGMTIIAKIEDHLYVKGKEVSVSLWRS